MIRSKGIRRSFMLKVCSEVKIRLLKLLKRARAVQQRAGNLISQRLMAFQPSSTQLSRSQTTHRQNHTHRQRSSDLYGIYSQLTITSESFFIDGQVSLLYLQLKLY